jgi:hypothetical protein
MATGESQVASGPLRNGLADIAGRIILNLSNPPEQWCFQARVKSGSGVVRLRGIIVLTAKRHEIWKAGKVNHGIRGIHGKGFGTRWIGWKWR